MRAVMEKLWFRLLMLALFLVSAAVALLSASMFRYMLVDGWFTDDFQFEDSSLCVNYVSECLYNVSANLSWLKDPSSTELGGYGGEAFSYRILEGDTVLADTTNDRSRAVTSLSTELDSDAEVSVLPAAAVEEDAFSNYSTPAPYSIPEAPADRVVVYTIEGYVNLPVEPYEGCYREYYIFQHIHPIRTIFLPLAIVGAVLAAFSLAVSLTAAAFEGRNGRLTLLGRFPFDVMAVGLYILSALVGDVIENWTYGLSMGVLSTIGISYRRIGSVCHLFAAALGGCCLANQLGARVFKEKLLLRRVILRVPPLAIAVGILAANIVGVMATLLVEDVIAFALIVFDLALIPCAVKWGLEARSIRKASSALAAGELHYKVDTGRLHTVWKDLGEDLNSIGDGMALAVEEQMRSERMKTELITNVSHDLKTPLTSIVNYVQLLMEEDLPEKERREYLEVLDRQSAKLKKLTEDVVEASRAVSGALTVSAEVFDVRELLEQSAGEYSERMAAAGIEPVMHLPAGETYILADPRLLGRVLDNLTTNVLKYAQAGTRAYFDLEVADGETVIAVKNISREPLDIPADELMERFVRGDSSRSTEGSGLGLSIARSLTELMGGRLQLTLDGDLFKAEIIFPSAEAPALPEMEAPEPEEETAGESEPGNA